VAGGTTSEGSIGSEDFEAQNELEVELVRAAHEPGFRDAFLRELLEAEVFLALLLADGSRVEVDAAGNAVVPPGARLELGPVEREGEAAFPFFSAPIRAQAFYRQDHVIAPDKVRDLFLRHPETRFVLNPGSDYAVDIDQTDVAAMLRGDFTAH
jgi:hypothetical protein